jgi:hypothetical protein
MNQDQGLPIFDLEVNYDPETNTVMIIANDLALEHLSDSCQVLLAKGVSESHTHYLQGVNGNTGNITELTIMKR